MDGFAEESNGSIGALYLDLDALRNPGVMQKYIKNTGAVVMEWKEFAMADDPDSYAGNYEFQVPIPYSKIEAAKNTYIIENITILSGGKSYGNESCYTF